MSSRFTTYAPALRPAPVKAPAMTMQMVRTEEAFLALEPEWDALVSRSATRTPFLRWDWVRGWWELHRDMCRPAMAVARGAEGRVLAIVPLVIGQKARWPHRHVRQIAFAGTIGEIASQEMDVIAPANFDVDALVAHALWTTRGEWDLARLDGIPEESPHYRGILRSLSACSYGAGVVNRIPTRFMRTPETWEAFEMSRSQGWRSKMRRKWKSLAKTPGMRAMHAGEGCSAIEGFADLARLHEIHYPKGVSEFLQPRSLEFHRRLSARWIPQKRALLPYVEIGGRTVGAIYGYCEGDRFFQYQMGWDPAFAHLSLGQLSIAWCVRSAIEQGTRDYDLLPGEADYKTRWCEAVRHRIDLEGFNGSSLRALTFRVLRGLRRLRTGAEPAVAEDFPTPCPVSED